MSRPARQWEPTWQRFPRVSGDEPLHHGDRHTLKSFSPRERG